MNGNDNNPHDYKPSWRKPAGMIAILAIIFIWAAIISSQFETIGSLPTLVQAIIYVVAGIIWIFPVRPLLTWMEIGRFRP